MFIVVYDIDGVILHYVVPPGKMVNAAYYCKFLQHHLHPELRKKLWHLVVQNPIMFHDNARSHTATAVMDLLHCWKWEILKHPPWPPVLLSLHQSERTTATDLVQHKKWTYPCYRMVSAEHQKRWMHWWCTMPSKHLAKGDKWGGDYIESTYRIYANILRICFLEFSEEKLGYAHYLKQCWYYSASKQMIPSRVKEWTANRVLSISRLWLQDLVIARSR